MVFHTTWARRAIIALVPAFAAIMLATGCSSSARSQNPLVTRPGTATDTAHYSADQTAACKGKKTMDAYTKVNADGSQEGGEDGTPFATVQLVVDYGTITWAAKPDVVLCSYKAILDWVDSDTGRIITTTDKGPIGGPVGQYQAPAGSQIASLYLYGVYPAPKPTHHGAQLAPLSNAAISGSAGVMPAGSTPSNCLLRSSPRASKLAPNPQTLYG